MKATTEPKRGQRQDKIKPRRGSKRSIRSYYLLTKWDRRFLDMAHLVASWSIDSAMRVGAVVVGDANVILATGFNGLPRGIDDYVDSRRQRGSAEKDLWNEHAERNAVYNAARVGISLNGTRMYTTHFPCAHCSRALIQSGVTVVVSAKGPEARIEKYFESWQRSIVMLAEAGVHVVCVDRLRKPLPEKGERAIRDQCARLKKEFLVPDDM